MQQKQSLEFNVDEKQLDSDAASLPNQQYIVDGVENLELFAEYEGHLSKEGNLRRGIQSRQIGMIAVSLSYNSFGDSFQVEIPKL